MSGFGVFRNIALFAFSFGVMGSSSCADPVGDLFDKIASYHGQEFESYDGYLFKGWLQIDENNPSYILYVDDRRFSVTLDDGRSTSQRANECREENIFDENPATGCSISFSGQYIVEDNGGSMDVSLIIWDVTFN